MDTRTAFFSIVLGLLAIISALIFRPFLTYILAAMVLAFVLHPVHERLTPTLGPNVSSLLLVAFAVVLAVGPLLALFGMVFTDAANVTAGLEEAPAVERVDAAFESVTGVEVALRSDIETAINEFQSILTGQASEIVGFAIHAFVGLTLLVFLLFYLLRDGSDLVAWLKDVTPLPAEVQDTLYEEANESTWAVLKGHVFVSFVQAVATGIGLFLVGIPNVAFWTLVLVFLAFLPIVGVATIWIPAAIYLLATGDVLEGVFLVAYGLTAIALIDDYLRAIVVDKQSSIHSAVILVGVFGAVYFIGAMGLFVGPIVLGLFKATIEVFDDYYTPD